MAKKRMTLKAPDRETLATCEEIARIHEFEGYDRVIERLSALEGIDPPKFGQVDGWHTMTLAGVEARSAVSGRPLLENWGAAARRMLARAA